MGDCRYCGQKAGWFSHAHEECEQKSRLGLQDMVALTAHCARTGQGLDTLEARLLQMSKANFVGSDQIKPALIGGWEHALHQVLHDNVVSRDEESFLTEFAQRFNLAQGDLNKNGAYTQLAKSAVLREVLEGKIPSKIKVDGQLPFNLQKEESLVWFFTGVPYYEQKVQRHFEGSSQGVSIRIMKGVYYRIGAFKGYPVETTAMTLVESGLFGITSQSLYFAGPVKSLRIPYSKIVSFTPYEDGIGICRDGASAKPQTFKTGDGWFTYNLVTNLAKLR